MRRRSQRAFTLLEMTIVIAVMLFLLTVALVASLDWGRSHAMRGSARQVRAGIALARQEGITRGNGALFRFGNEPHLIPPRGYFVAGDSEGDWENTNYLARGVVFRFGGGLSTNPVAFRSDGSGGGDASDWPAGLRDLVLWEDARGADGMIATLRVSRITGAAGLVE